MINNCTLVGRLVADPNLRYTSSGNPVATFTLAVNRNFTSADGNREADFINCVIWRKPAETLANYAKKGVLIGVTGRIQTRSYDNQQGQKVYVTEVVADNFHLLESKNSNSGRNKQGSGVSNSQTNNNANTQQNRNSAQPDPFSNSSIDIDDSLPF
ncbi:single-stranded DNA-binding protein [Enterococcus gallinarum]|uniref:single-stranded DNA-binding protein n=1 Tax=Enterococcus gallinarum TaxID=1353 RepID=UPI00288D7A4C|nr:single-stranded DNA-binding protein [Enterococcus gallinarum]MDT2697514.1 single-stranded DNA-binding protein [Enterococcus gallinarum]